MLISLIMDKNIFMQDFEIRNRVAENIKRIRKQKKYTQFQLAEKSNLSEATIKSIELAHSYPEEKTLSQITEALGIDVVKLFMPIETSFSDDKNTKQLKETLAQSIKIYVDEILEEFR